MEIFKSEEEFVEFIKRFELPHPYLKEGIGDDCLILEIDKKLIAITTDSYRENVHFKKRYLDLKEIAYRCVAGALSDLAACGAKPITILISLFIPENFSKEEIEKFYTGISELSKSYGISVTGGDLVKEGDELSFTITCIGEIDDYPILRKGAREGDLLCITGNTGNVLAALEILEDNLEINEKIKEPLIQKFKFPKPRISEMLYLKEEIKITSGIDISDGIAKDARRLADSSKVKIIIEEERMPFSRELLYYTNIFQKNILDYILNSGEEYEILFTVPDSEKEKLPDWIKIIGKVEKGRGLYLKTKESKIIEIKKGGYDYFYG